MPRQKDWTSKGAVTKVNRRTERKTPATPEKRYTKTKQDRPTKVKFTRQRRSSVVTPKRRNNY